MLLYDHRRALDPSRAGQAKKISKARYSRDGVPRDLPTLGTIKGQGPGAAAFRTPETTRMALLASPPVLQPGVRPVLEAPGRRVDVHEEWKARPVRVTALAAAFLSSAAAAP
jgi:hypothetical protein